MPSVEDIFKGIVTLGSGIYGYKHANDSNRGTQGYQGEIPDYSLVREEVQDTYIPPPTSETTWGANPDDPDGAQIPTTTTTPGRVPGSRGQRYFSDASFVTPAEEPAARQTAFDQSLTLRDDNYARAGIAAPELQRTDPSGYSSVTKQLDYTDRNPDPETLIPDDPNKTQFFPNGMVYMPGMGANGGPGWFNMTDMSGIMNLYNTGVFDDLVGGDTGDVNMGAGFGYNPITGKEYTEWNRNQFNTQLPDWDQNNNNMVDPQEWGNFQLRAATDPNNTGGSIWASHSEDTQRYIFDTLEEGIADQRIDEKTRTDIMARMKLIWPQWASELKVRKAQGGLISLGYAQGGPVGRYLGGPTDGMADKLPANIDGQQDAALSDGEFVIPADVVSHFGNGNSEAGADVLYNMMANVRQARTGNPEQGQQIDPNQFLSQMGGIA